MSTTAEHVTSVFRYQPYPEAAYTVHGARCTCGWAGTWRGLRTTAVDDAVRHLDPKHERDAPDADWRTTRQGEEA